MAAAGGALRRVVVAELNDGQMRREIERLACQQGLQRADIAGVHRLDGELITPQQILEEASLP